MRHSEDFVYLERLRENVVPPAIKHLSPKGLIGKWCGDNYARRPTRVIRKLKKFTPVPVRDDYGYLVLGQKCDSLAFITGFVYGPGIAQNRRERTACFLTG